MAPNAFQQINEPTRLTEHSASVINHVMWESRNSLENACFTGAPSLKGDRRRGVEMTNQTTVNDQIK